MEQNTHFQLPEEGANVLKVMKQKLAQTTLHAIDKALPFTVQTNDSDFAIGATLNQIMANW